MKWLTIDWIAAHSRLDIGTTERERDILELSGDSAEQMVLNITNRTYEDIIECYGEVPKPLFHAALMLVETSYDNRSPISSQQTNLIPMGFDMAVKPYIKLT